MPAKAPDFKPGELLPGTKYRVVKELGAGGMGVVYLVVKPPQIQGVLKLMSTDLTGHEEFRTRFLDEVRILAQIDHPNIVRVFDYDSLSDGTPYYVMEVLHGRTVRDVLATMGKVPPRVAYEVTRQLLEALHCAHTHDVTVVHRDIKPENIFLHAPRHGEPVVKLIDFGVIAVADRKHDGFFVGTWKYAAPEQIRGEVATPATDLYAVGLVLYEMLSGIGPFDHVDSGSLVSQAHLHEMPAPVNKFAPWVPASIVTLIQSALSKDPKMRPRSAYAFAERLFELEWASDGKDPHDATVEGPAGMGIVPPKNGRGEGSIGALSHVLSTVGAKPSSKNLKAAAPAGDRLGDVPLIGVPEAGVHTGNTLRGVGNKQTGRAHELTSPDEDALLDGLGAKADAKPISKKARDSGRNAFPHSDAKVIIHAETGAPPIVERTPSAPTLDAPPSEPKLTPSDVAITAPRAARAASAAPGRLDTDTFSSQESDARPIKKATRPWIHGIAASVVVLGVASILFVRHRVAARDGSTAQTREASAMPVIAVPPPPTTNVPAPSASAPPPTVASTSSVPSSPPTTKGTGRPKHGGAPPAERSAGVATTSVPTAEAPPRAPTTTAKPAAPARTGDYDRTGP